MSNSSPPTSSELNSHHAFRRLVQIVAALRDPKTGCPWDLEQTHQSLKPYLLEEAYEAHDAVDSSPQKLCEELGDVLLQVVLHAQIGAESGNFTIDDVAHAISHKLVSRHPHVFGDTQVADSSEVLRNWQRLKRDESSSEPSILSGLPNSMPALLRALHTGEKAAGIGFDWRSAKAAREKVSEELAELAEAVAVDEAGDAVDEELGDVFFALAQYARKLKRNPETVLIAACKKFQRRFESMEATVGDIDLRHLSPDELEELWQQAKEKTSAAR